MPNFAASAVPTNGITLLGAKPSTGTTMAKFDPVQLLKPL